MKKFNAQYITRTVIFTKGTAVKANMKEMSMEELEFTVIGNLEGKELLSAVKENYGEEIVGIKIFESVEEKRRISVSDFLKYSEIVSAKEEEV